MIRRWLVIIALSLSLQAQAQTVTVPDDVARYYLEQNERVKILSQNVTDLRAEIAALNAKIANDKAIINEHINTEQTYGELIVLKREQLTYAQHQLDKAKADLRKAKFKIIVAYAIAGLVVMITLLASHG